MKYFLHFIFWASIFFEGVFQLLGIPSFIYKPLYPGIPLVLFTMVLFQNFDGIKLPAIKYVLLLFPLIIISGVINGINTFDIVYFTVFLLYPIFYFYVVINDASLNIKRLARLVVFLILIQIPAVLIKFSILGISEKGAIGTMSTGMGSLSAIFPLFIIAFLLPLFYKRNKKIYILLIGLFTFFGIVGEKRAIYVMIPILILFSIISYSLIKSFSLNTKLIRTWGYSFVAGGIILYSIIVLNPSLNPENKVGGSFDPHYVYDYTMDYTSSETKSLKEIRRSAGLIYFMNYSVSNLKTALVGDGAGNLIQSGYSSNPGTMLDHYGVRYGGRMGVIWMILQVGFIGLLIFLLIHFRLFSAFKKRLNNRRSNVLYAGYINLLFVLCLDFFFYSRIAVHADVVYSLFMFVVAVLYLGYDESILNYRKIKL